MQSQEIERVALDNVSLVKFSHMQFAIRFHMYNQAFFLLFNKGEEVYHLVSIFHGSSDTCVVCKQKERSMCDELEKYLSILYHRLVEHPSVRLKLLYLPHDCGVY